MITPSKTMTSTFPYQIEEKIGAGGMGVVYRAFEPSLNRMVAIKVLRTSMFDEESPAIADEYRKRFMQEARAAAALSHPGVATIYRIGEEDGTPYIAMEWLDGETLEDILDREGSLPSSRVARLGLELVDALAVAHHAGVVHRDIKPANLIILTDGRLKVTDFGIARVADSDLVKTGSGTILATPQYASPEQLQGIEVDGRSDLYSTGVLLYQAASGRLPFRGHNYFELMAALARAEATPICDIAPSVDSGLESVIMKAIRRDPGDRFATAADMAAALKPLAVPGSGFSDNATMHITASERVPSTILDAPQAEPAPYPSIAGLPEDPRAMIVRLVEGWSPRNLGVVSTSSILAKILERPLHAPPFAGGVFLGSFCLLIYGGFIVGAIDSEGRSTDEICDRLPEQAPAILYTAPDDFPVTLVPLMASLLHPPQVRHRQIDTGIVNLPALAARFREEQFDGYLKLHRGDATAYIFFDKGNTGLTLFTDGWEDIPVTTTWESWVSKVSLTGMVGEKVWRPAQLSYRRELRDFELSVAPPVDSSSGAKIRQTFLRKTSHLEESGRTDRITSLRTPADPVDVSAIEAFYAGDPIYQFLEWAIEELPAFFQERDRSAKWKYLSEWLQLVRGAKLHHDLPRPDSHESDFFDLVTFDDKNKVMHLAQRVPRGTPEALQQFIDRVVAAKKARIKTGDVGGAFLIAPAFDESMLDAYRASTKPVGTGLLALEEKLTKYEGFVRIGPRRGFHLLLVIEKKDGFEPLLLV
ncbi:MAG TPA: serine/threonine-protein kinase [Blastocatellia bacterium]|nr:serine/threonine-protein kinase [Blastocatellia bacterium]